MYNKKDRVIYKSTKTKDPNIKWVRKTGTILEVIVVDERTAYNIINDEDKTIEPVLVTAVESKV